MPVRTKYWNLLYFCRFELKCGTDFFQKENAKKNKYTSLPLKYMLVSYTQCVKYLNTDFVSKGTSPCAYKILKFITILPF